MSSAELVEVTEPIGTIKTGSKSFFLASLIFGRRMREASWTLYAWCRHCDDLVDSAESREASATALEYARLQTRLALKGEPAEEVFANVGRLCREYGIPEKLLEDLLIGFELDVEGKKYSSILEVERYSYHVAGVVGVMMVYMMGVSDRKALANAIDLGSAMQITNICRDVKEDHANGRLYLPLAWLQDEGLNEKNYFMPYNRERLYRVVLRALDHADRLYGSGYRGLMFLPLRAAVTISFAGSVYRAIGQKIRSEGVKALDARAHVSLLGKLALLGRSLARVAPIAIARLLWPWTRVALDGVRRPS